MTLSSTALLRPQCVALIGVSDDPSKTAGRPLQFLRRAGFAGEIFVINPRRETVQGERAYRSLADLPRRPDHAFILTDAEKALDSLEECQRLGVPVATMLSSGFAESGDKGSANQARLEAILARGGLRLVGPSSIGVVNLHTGLTLTANAAFAEPDLPKGGIFVGSHSGSLIGALVSRGKRKGIGFAGLVSVGAETDLSIGEICMATLDDPQITSYMLFIETLRHADKLHAFAVEASRRGKPVAAFKLGRSEEAAELAVSHTGSLAGADEVADVFLAECGIARVESFEGLLEVMPLLKHVPASSTGRRQGRVGVVTTTGGGAAMAVDQLALRGVDVVPASAQTRARLREKGIEPGQGRIIDLTLAGTRYDVMKATLDVLRSAPEFDLILATAGSSARFNPELVVQPAVDASGEPGHPLGVFLVPDAPEATRLLARAGVPAFQDPETCGDAIAAALHRRLPSRSAPLDTTPLAGEITTLNEAECYRLLERHGLTPAPHLVLRAAEPVPELPFAYPVVAKVLHGGIAHKSDTGGVVLQIADRSELADAMAAIVSQVRANTGVDVSEILVQQMARGVGEVLVGFRRDPQVGPMVILAAGGIFTELYRDSTMRLAPVDRATALEMIGEIKASRILDGYRGGAVGDLEALANAIVSVSRLATQTAPRIEELEINPLLVLPQGQGVCAIDGFGRIVQ
ncbi:MAG: acetate--CoA ligase family protein [Alphaproteobacteria bacterium]|jgi:acetate---CoA ligase (ADP-forming)|nr:acetate--CoA ligase family protein [Alphaproteobacteria bacterium]MBU1551313.1 acetate--CoA ligase family protein [Alphaproteobacteria bacterium]MBU2334752.1 acetate--CoA ligase family protein [Alphaproteobacteria bacterium]MBU2389255.1 acetate--CoA ligase family protein [Alphaproteobacteria bacterium]